MNNSTNNICIVFLITAIGSVFAPPSKVDNVEANLIDTLTSQYPGGGLARPVSDFDSPFLTVNISLLITDFDDLDEINGLLLLSGRVIAEWKDANLQWNTSEYSNIDKIQLRASSIWLPPLVQYNYPPDFDVALFARGGTDSLATVWVDNTGQVTAIHAGALLTKCDINLRKFPFDTQSCTYIYSTYAYSKGELVFQPRTVTFSGEDADPAGVWQVENYGCVSTTIESSNGYETFSSVTCDFDIGRRPEWFLVNFLVPSILLSLLQLSAFFMPFGEGRAGFCIAVVLAFAVFQSMTTSLLPKTSTSITLINYFIIQMSIGTVCTLNAIYVNFLYNLGIHRGKRVGKNGQWILRFFKLTDFSSEREELEKMISLAQGTKGLPRQLVNENSIQSNFEAAVNSAMNELRHYGSFIAKEKLNKLEKEQLEEEWLRVAIFVDYFVAIGCLLVTLFSNVLVCWPLYS